MTGCCYARHDFPSTKADKEEPDDSEMQQPASEISDVVFVEDGAEVSKLENYVMSY
jgi:hypothetical protein